MHPSQRGRRTHDNSGRRCRHVTRIERSAELPPDDGARDCAPGRSDHLDDDVPIVTPIVQQAEQAADAADAHTGVRKMDMI